MGSGTISRATKITTIATTTTTTVTTTTTTKISMTTIATTQEVSDRLYQASHLGFVQSLNYPITKIVNII